MSLCVAELLNPASQILKVNTIQDGLCLTVERDLDLARVAIRSNCNDQYRQITVADLCGHGPLSITLPVMERQIWN